MLELSLQPLWLLYGFAAGALLGAFITPLAVIKLATAFGVGAFAGLCYWPDAFGGHGADLFGGIVMGAPGWGAATLMGGLCSYWPVRALRRRGYLQIRKRARFMNHPDR